ncbi:phage portal protein [Clostridium felsineum]|uniref:phage portal protein n=1 Tax=Clostridium felsineum TaxID=36839 RepID=UPI0009CB1995|nr:phage portal protein [Clostridium felsineum]URZ16869.1 hypothetical protein CLFE_029160 [Clostridium felsineum DSM 794]
MENNNNQTEQIEVQMTDIPYFREGAYYPPTAHRERIDRYKKNKKVFKGEHFEVFKEYNGSKRYRDLLYISVNIAGIICKKSADFLFGESVQVKAGNGDESIEQQAFDRFVQENDLNILNYESALANAYRGDSFFKVRYGQEMGGEVPEVFDKPRVIIESQTPEYVFPEASLYNKNKIVAYHIAVPVEVVIDGVEGWQLFIESHYAGRIEYRVFNMSPVEAEANGIEYEIKTWKIDNEIQEAQQIVLTGVPMPLIVHVPNFGTDDTWQGLDDITEHLPIIDEINNRLTQIADILDKHADPAMVVPAGTLGTDIEGNPYFVVARDKVFEAQSKNDVKPEYITWDGQLQQAFTELEKLINLLLTMAEIPGVALGMNDGGGTSGTSGLAIKWRMNSLLAKINRKRQYYTRGLKQVFTIAQLLELAVGKADYALTLPLLTFQDGLPKDDAEEATVMNIRTGGAKTISQKTAIMRMEGMTAEQAEREIEQIKEEEQQAVGQEPITDLNYFNATDTTANAEGNTVTDNVNNDPTKTGYANNTDNTNLE